MFQVSKRDYFTVRNEWWRDERGERSGFASTYSSHTVGWSHQREEPGFRRRPGSSRSSLGKRATQIAKRLS